MAPTASATQIALLRRAALRATLAASMRDTQPWRLHLCHDRLDFYADPSRRLAVLDPNGRQMLISCGCALMNARVSLAGAGIGVRVTRTRSPGRADPVASLSIDEDRPDAALAVLDPVLEARATNRRRVDDGPVPDEILHMLTHVAAAENSSLVVVRTALERLTVVELSQHAEHIENISGDYRLQTSPSFALTPDNHTLAVLCTEKDSPEQWLRAGEALERVLLEVTRKDYAAIPHTPIIEVPVTRAQLRQDLGLSGYPHVLLRIGPALAAPTAPRRALAGALSESPHSAGPWTVPG